MNKLICLSFFFVLSVWFSAANGQVSYTSSNSIVMINDLTYDQILANHIKGSLWSPIANMKADVNSARPWWPTAIPVLTVDKSFICAGVATNKIALISADVDTNPEYMLPRPVNLLDSLASAAFIHSYKVKISRIVCGASPINSSHKIAYIFNHIDFQILSTSSEISNTSWINGVVVNNGGSAPSNPVSTNWGFDIVTAGTYEIYAHWVSNKNTVSNISYAFDGQAATSANLDQNISSGIWVKLGASKTFTAGSHNVTISVDPTAFYVVDGIKVERVQ